MILNFHVVSSPPSTKFDGLSPGRNAAYSKIDTYPFVIEWDKTIEEQKCLIMVQNLCSMFASFEGVHLLGIPCQKGHKLFLCLIIFFSIIEYFLIAYLGYMIMLFSYPASE